MHRPRCIRRSLCTAYQTIGTGMHQFEITLRVDRPRQRQAAACIIYTEDGTNQTQGIVVLAQHGKWKQQAGSGQAVGVVAQVAFIDGQRRLAIEFIKHVTLRTRHLARRAERLPATEGSMAEKKTLPTQTNRNDDIVAGTVRTEREGALKRPAIARQAGFSVSWSFRRRRNNIITYLVLALARHPLALGMTLTQGFLVSWISVL
jgi:hypothetical protein